MNKSAIVLTGIVVLTVAGPAMAAKPSSAGVTSRLAAPSEHAVTLKIKGV